MATVVGEFKGEEKVNQEREEDEAVIGAAMSPSVYCTAYLCGGRGMHGRGMHDQLGCRRDRSN